MYRDWPTTSRNTRVAFGASLAIAIVVGWLGYASFFHFVLGAAAAGLLALPTGVCLLAWLMWRFLPLRSRGEFDASLAAIGRYSAALALALILSWPVGLLVGAPLRANARTWMLAQTAAVDSYFETHGTYPASLEDVVDMSVAPRLVRNGFTVYRRWETHYGFFMGDGMFEDEWAWISPSGEH
jgi:hypothetical protein